MIRTFLKRSKSYFNFLWCFRQDKPKVLPITRTATGKLPPIRVPEVMVNSGKIIIKSDDAKEKLEQQLRAQRNVQIQKRVADMKQGEFFFCY